MITITHRTMIIHTVTPIINKAALLWRKLKRACAVSMLFMVGGCSALELGYNNGPALVHLWVTDQVKLYPEQSDLLAAQFEELFQWHRVHELPYLLKQLQWLHSLAGTLNQLSVNEVREFSDSIKESFYRTGHAAAPLMARSMLGLWLDQIQTIQSALAQSNQEYREEHLALGVEQRRAEALQKMLNRFESWLGELSVAQTQMIHEWASTQGFPYEERYQRRLESQAKFMNWVELAANRAISEDELRQGLDQWVDGWRGSEHTIADAELEKHRWQTAQLVVDVANISSPEQREFFKAELNEWIEALNDLIAEQN